MLPKGGGPCPYSNGGHRGFGDVIGTQGTPILLVFFNVP